MLGLNPKRCKMKPSKEHMKEAILEIFDVPMNDREQYKAFDKGWLREIKKKVLMTFNNYSDRFSTSAHNEFWRLLGVSKPVNARE